METGNPKRLLRRASGFSLLEIIIVIAVIALIGGLVVVNANAILSGLGAEPTERVLQKAVREARYQAALRKEPVRLRFDRETAGFVITAYSGSELHTFTTAFTDNPRDLQVTFDRVLPFNGVTFGTNPRTAPTEAIIFQPDRSSTPFIVHIREAGQNFSLRYDPFSAIAIHDSRSR